jgi:hypothetical protein
MTDADEYRRLLKSVRGRRLLLCRGTDLLRDIVTSMGEDNGEGPEFYGEREPITPRRRADLLALVEVLRSMLITANDGGGRAQG